MEFIKIENLIQLFILVVLIYYTRETWVIRRISQEQNEIMQKPCLVPSCGPRDYDMAVLSKGDFNSGERILAGIGSNQHYVGLRNIGNGNAFNVRYKFQQQEAPAVCREGYDLPYVLRQKEEPICLPLNCLSPSGEHEYSELTLSYESLGKRRYESKIRIHADDGELVMTDFQFKELKPQSRWG